MNKVSFHIKRLCKCTKPVTGTMLVLLHIPFYEASPNEFLTQKKQLPCDDFVHAALVIRDLAATKKIGH